MDWEIIKIETLFFSKSAKELSTSDLLFITLIAEMTLSDQHGDDSASVITDTTSSEEFYSPQSSPILQRKTVNNSGKT